jgi:homoserine kinase type II
MAVFTQIADEELREFLAAYDIGELISCKGIADGVQNTNFLLETENGRFILTLYENQVEEGDLPFFLGLMEYLAKRGVKCPLPVHDRKGEALGRLAGRPAAMVSFLRGASVMRPGRAHCRELGAALARMHMAAANFDMRRKNILGPAGWRAMFAEIRDDLPRIELDGGNPEAIIATIEESLQAFEEDWPQAGYLPEGVIHADLFPDNAFFKGEKLSGLIDFYFACNDFLAYDLAICLNAWCFEKDGGYNVTLGRALLEGYDRLRPLEKEELEALPVLARGAALRFFLTRLRAWLNPPPGLLVKRHDPREYMRRLRFHRDLRHGGQYGYERLVHE